MDTFFGCFALLALSTLLVPFVLSVSHARRLKTLEATLQKLTARLAALETTGATGSAVAGIADPGRQQSAGPAPEPRSPTPATATPPPPVFVPAPAPRVASPAANAPVPPPSPVAPVIAPVTAKPRTAAPARPAKPAIDWEAFMGVKLFAWVGGFALFLGVVFLVKYSFENNLITPVMRVVLGAIIGCALVAAGWFTSRRNYRVPGQSLCATGVLVLYADIFGAHTFYGLLSLGAAFALMSLVTVAAFLLAVRMDAPVVVVLGLVGGFLTPLLLTTGDRPLPTFSYIALLNLGIAAVALRKRWDYLFILGAVGTVLLESLWLPVNDAAQMRLGLPIFLGLQAQFLAFAYLRQRLQPNETWSTPAAALVGAGSIGYAFALLGIPALARRPGFFFAVTFLADVGLLALAMWRPNPSRIAAPAGAAIFALLSAWTVAYLDAALLWWALGAYLLFAVIHAGFSVWPGRTHARPATNTWQAHVPLLALVLLFICVWRGETSFAVWVCVLLVNVVALGLAAATRSIAALVVALFATTITAGLWVLTAPPVGESIVGILIVIGAFGVFFATASTFLSRQFGLGGVHPRRNVPVLAAAMPFVLLLMLIAKLPVGNPTAVFVVALIMAVVLLGLGVVAKTSWIAAVALAFTWAVEREWHTLHFTNTSAPLALGWYVAFFLLFAAYPFFTAEERALPWAVGAMSGALHFWLIFELISSAYPHLRNGLLPAVFVLPYALGVAYLIKQRRVIPASGDARLAWQGGAALLFLSLIFPVQFEREWITLGWALEGFALLLLFRAVPNPGLRLVGAGLLSVAFVRLALNPAVFEYHRRTPTRIWNWYLYAYGLTIACLFAGARIAGRDALPRLRGFSPAAPAADAQERVPPMPLVARVIPRLLYTLGAILTFLLLNIEIADYFSVGPTLTFSFTGNFARDMTYSIAWALFAFALLLIGMKGRLRYVRYAGMALLLVTLVKLFLHDLANLGPLYRIGAFIGVAVILIAASFVYQRFLAPETEKTDEPL